MCNLYTEFLHHHKIPVILMGTTNFSMNPCLIMHPLVHISYDKSIIGSLYTHRNLDYIDNPMAKRVLFSYLTDTLNLWLEFLSIVKKDFTTFTQRLITIKIQLNIC